MEAKLHEFNTCVRGFFWESFVNNKLTDSHLEKNRNVAEEKEKVIHLRKKCPYSELFWSVFSRIWTEYGEILRISPYSVRMRENADQNNSE